MNPIHQGIALGFTDAGMKHASLAREVQECECLIVSHRGKDRLNELRILGITTRSGYLDLIKAEADEIKNREFL